MNRHGHDGGYGCVSLNAIYEDSIIERTSALSTCPLQLNPATYRRPTYLVRGVRTWNFRLAPRARWQTLSVRLCWCQCGLIKSMPVQGIAKIDVSTGKTLQKWLPEAHQFLRGCILQEGSSVQKKMMLSRWLLNEW
jgi:hypothetical protein